MYYTVIFDGTDLCEEFGAVLSKFEMEPPEPKVTKVEIPAGSDLDITESVGFVAYHNGKHTFALLLRGDDLPEQLRRLTGLVHGAMADYTLSWDPGYTYRGRWAIESVERLAANGILVTCVVDRYPWKTSGVRDSIDINSHPTATDSRIIGVAVMSGSTYYDDIKLKTLQADATAKVGAASAVTLANAGTHDLMETIYGKNAVAVTMPDWWQYLDGTNLVVNTANDRYSLDGTDATFGSDWEKVGTDLYCANEAKQHSTLSFGRRDL